MNRGYDRKQIGISATKAFRMKIKKKLEEVKGKFIYYNSDSNKRQRVSRVVDIFQSLEY